MTTPGSPTSPPTITVEGVSPEQSACLARKVGDAVEVVVVNLGAEPVSRLQLGLEGSRIRAATPLLEPPRAVRLERGRILDRLPAYGVCVYRVQVSDPPLRWRWWPWR